MSIVSYMADCTAIGEGEEAARHRWELRAGHRMAKNHAWKLVSGDSSQVALQELQEMKRSGQVRDEKAEALGH